MSLVNLIRYATENPEVRADVLPYVYRKSAAFRSVVGMEKLHAQLTKKTAAFAWGYPDVIKQFSTNVQRVVGAIYNGEKVSRQEEENALDELLDVTQTEAQEMGDGVYDFSDKDLKDLRYVITSLGRKLGRRVSLYL